jgi:hypothetical protein
MGETHFQSHAMARVRTHYKAQVASGQAIFTTGEALHHRGKLV